VRHCFEFRNDADPVVAILKEAKADYEKLQEGHVHSPLTITQFA
jgi:hypothetical protein